MKRIIFSIALFASLTASAQIPYETSVFWQFLEGFQGGDSSTQNYLEYKNNFLLLKTDQRDAKILHARNELNDIGISTLFIDANGNGGFSIDSAGGQTVIKLRGALNDHSYLNNTHVSVGRGGQTQDYGGNVDGAKFTVSDEREPGYGLWDANNYQMMLQSSKDSIGGYVGLAFTSESATQDRNVGGFINYRKTGNNGRGELHFGTKTATGSLADGIHAMKIYDGSVTIDSTIVLPNLYTGTSDTTLIISNDTIYKKVSSSDNIYTADGTLTGDRTVTMNGNELILEGTHSFNYDLKITDLAITLPSNSATLSSTFTRAADGAILSMRNNSNVENVLMRSYASGGVQGHFTAGKIGIGTTAPSGYLHVENTLTTGVGAIIENSDAANTDDIAQFQNSTGTVASITNEGGITASHDVTFTGGSGGSKVLSWNGDDLDISGSDGQFTTGQVYIHGTRGMSSGSFGKGQFYFAGTYDNAPYINRNIADANPALIIDQEHAGSTGDIAQFWNSTGTVASITNDGYITAQAATGTSDTVAIWDGTTLKKKELKNRGVLGVNPRSDVSAGNTRYCSIVGSQSFGVNIDDATFVVTSDGVMSNAYVYLRIGQPVDASMTVTLFKNNVATSLVITIPAGQANQTVVSNTLNSVSVSAGDLLHWRAINNSASTSAKVSTISVEFQFD